MKRRNRAILIAAGFAALAAYFHHFDRELFVMFYLAMALFALLVMVPLGEWLDRKEVASP